MFPEHQKPVIFLAFANDQTDQSQPFRNLPDELRRIRQNLQVAEEKGLCEVVVRTNSSMDGLLDVFLDKQYRHRIAVFHFGGQAGAYQSLIDSFNKSPQITPAGGLPEFLGQQSGLQLVFLNGCSTEPQAKDLLEANIPAVFATTETIDDHLTIELASHFYGALAGGASIETAYQESSSSAKTIHDSQQKSRHSENGPIELSTRIFILSNSSASNNLPWNLYTEEGSEFVKTWNLPEASGNTLLSLPDLDKQDLPVSPFRHLHWFREEEAELFFGRRREIRALFEMISKTDHAPVLLFYGQAGVGKSSLLASGLLPRIKQTHETLYIRQQFQLGLGGTLAHGLKIPNPSEVTADLIKKAWLWHENKNGAPLVVVLDQLDEVFGRLTPDQLGNHLQAFVDMLNYVFMDNENRPAGKLILSFQKEWLPAVETACKHTHLNFSTFLLNRLDRNGTIEAIEGTSSSDRLKKQYGLEIEDGLSALIADDLLDDLSSPLAPTLQTLLTKMWQIARQGNLHEPAFTTELYHTLKKQGIQLSDFLTQQLDDIHKRYPFMADSGLVLDVLARHVSPHGTAATCTIEDLMDIYAHEKKQIPVLLKEFKELYLVVPVEQEVNGLPDDATCLIHDTLAPLIQQLHTNSDRTGQRALRILENYVHEWKEGQIGTLLDESELLLVEAGKSGMHNWTNDEQRLIMASRRARAKRKRVRNRIRMGVVAAVALITAFGFYASSQQDPTDERENQRATQAEIARQKAQDAKALAEQQQAEARHLQLLAEATETTDTETTEIEAIETAPGLQESFTIAHEEEPARKQQIPTLNAKGAHVQRTAPADRAMATNLQRRRPLALALSSKALLRLGSNDNNTAALLAREAFQFNKEVNGEYINEVYNTLRHTLNAVDKGKGGPLVIHPSQEDWVRTLGFSPIDEWVISSSNEFNDDNVYLWSPKARPDEAIVLLAQQRSVVRELQLNPNSSLFATVGDDHQLRVWKNQNREFEEIHKFDIQEGIVRGMAFQPEGNHIALAGESNVLYILPVKGEANQSPLSISTDGYVVHSLSFSSDGKWLVAGDNSGYLRIWSWKNLTGSPIIVQAHRGAVRTVAFNNNFLVTGGEDTKVGLWKIDSQGTPKLVKFLRGHSGPVNTAAISPDGTHIATGSTDRTVRLWNIQRAGIEAPVILNGHSSWIESVRFGADGRSLASSDADRSIRIWRINPEDLANDICKAVSYSLTQTEWENYAGEDIDYPDSCKSTDFAHTTTTIR